MSITLIFKIAGVGILVSVLCQVLKQFGKDDLGNFAGLAGLLLVLWWIVPYIAQLFQTMQNLFSL